VVSQLCVYDFILFLFVVIFFCVFFFTFISSCPLFCFVFTAPVTSKWSHFFFVSVIGLYLVEKEEKKDIYSFSRFVDVVLWKKNTKFDRFSSFFSKSRRLQDVSGCWGGAVCSDNISKYPWDHFKTSGAHLGATLII
jgi:hypothetical protein